MLMGWWWYSAKSTKKIWLGSNNYTWPAKISYFVVCTTGNALTIPSVVVIGKQCALEMTLPNELPGTPGFHQFYIQISSENSSVVLGITDTKVTIPYSIRSQNVNYHISVSTVNHCGQRGPLTVVPTFSADTTRCCLGEDCGEWLLVPCTCCITHILYGCLLLSDNDSMSISKAHFVILITALCITVVIVFVCLIPCVTCICMLRRSTRYKFDLYFSWCLSLSLSLSFSFLSPSAQ